MTDLSSAGQAVLDATYNTYNPADSLALRRCVAAALRAAAGQMAAWADENGRIDLDDLFAIAAELEGME